MKPASAPSRLGARGHSRDPPAMSRDSVSFLEASYVVNFRTISDPCSSPKRQRILSVLLGLCLSLLALSAHAGDRVQWKKKSFNEAASGAWRLDMTFFMTKAPDMAHVPFKFEFRQVVYFERSRVDGRDDPIDRKVPMKNQTPKIQSVDVGFMDVGRGEIQKRTRFSFKLDRDIGYEAGVYQVTVRHSRSGRKIGTPTKITLNGENEIIDRRSMVFETKEKKKKDDDDDPDEDKPVKENYDRPALTPQDDEFWAGGSDDDDDNPGTIQEKPGAGCQLCPRSASRNAGWLGLLALLVPLRRRRS